MNQELYDSIYGSLVSTIRVETAEENLFLHELTLQAVAGAEAYMTDLQESIGHLKETIKRLSKEQGLDTVR
mgnify:CR=1 FL=1